MEEQNQTSSADAANLAAQEAAQEFLKSDPEAARITGDEERTLGRIQKHLETRELRTNNGGMDYDAEMLSLRDQIHEARMEDVPPLIEEMERLSEVAARRAKVTQGAVDVKTPYFGHLVLEEDDKRREVLIGKSTYLDSRTGIRIVDWRDAPVSRIYYRYDEGDDYEENFGGRLLQGEVITRRTVAINDGVLRRVGSPQGTFIKNALGVWRRAGDNASKLKGGQGAAMRPEGHHKPAENKSRDTAGKLGIGENGLPGTQSDDRFLPEITALIDPRQFELITKSDAGLVVIQGGAGSGKTTIGLHRMAYLTFANPQRFRADTMLVLVFNDALVRYISRVLPSLGAGGVPVTTFERWANKLRVFHLRGLPSDYSSDTPNIITRFKKHPMMLKMIDQLAIEAAQSIDGKLVAALEGIDGKDEAIAFYREQSKAPLAVRLLRLKNWANGAYEDGEEGLKKVKRDKNAEAALKPIALRHAIERTVQEARRENLDIVSIWSELLTNETRVRAAIAKYAPDDFDADDIASVLRWCTDRCERVLSIIEAKQSEDGPRRVSRAPSSRSGISSSGDRDRDFDSDAASERVIDQEERPRRAKPVDEDDPHGDDDRSIGIDGADEYDTAELDREDDALLLRLTQRLRGPLVKPGGDRSKTKEGNVKGDRLRYEHILIDEAQDLSPVELSVVASTASKDKSITMAGDVAQRLHMENGFRGWKELFSDVQGLGAAGKDEFVEVEPLKVQYRSTHQIIEFSNAVLGHLADPDSGHAIRDGAEVELFQFGGSGEAVAFLGEALRDLMQAEPRATVALISRFPEQADIYYKGLQHAEVPNIRRIAEQDFPFKAGIDITDIRQVKGLEFDYVILVDVNESSFPNSDEARHLLHIAGTRAAHQLWVTTSGPVSKLLPQELVDRSY